MHSASEMEKLIQRLASDVREHLHQLIGALDLMRDETVPARSCYSLCRASAQRVLRDANDISDLLEPAPPSRPSPFAWRTAVEDIAGLMGVLAERRKGTVTHMTASRRPETVVADAQAIEDVLYRLLDHAINSAPGTAIELYSGIEPSGLTLVLCGEGIFEESAFIPHLAKRKVLAAGGTFTASPCRYRWSFPITAPVTAGQAEAGTVVGPRDQRVRMRLLVAEDCDESFTLFETFVRGEGHRITRALNGAEAVELAKSEVDLIVMDVNMPVKDGYQATREIRAWEAQNGARRRPIVLLSAEALPSQTERGAEAGCSGYLAKPTTRAQVLRTLRFHQGAES